MASIESPYSVPFEHPLGRAAHPDGPSKVKSRIAEIENLLKKIDQMAREAHIAPTAVHPSSKLQAIPVQRSNLSASQQTVQDLTEWFEPKLLKEAIPAKETMQDHENIPSSKGTYNEQIKRFAEENGVPPESSLFRFLLKPENRAFREDLLRAATWKGFSDPSLLLHEMERRFQTKNCPTEERKEILEFTEKLIKRGLWSRESLLNSPLLDQALRLISSQERRNAEPSLVEAAKALIAAEPEALIEAEKIRYHITSQAHSHEGNLTAQWHEIAAGRMRKSKTNKFIQAFAQDLAGLSYNIARHTLSREFNQALAKEKQGAPNIHYSAIMFNQLSSFCVDQLLMASSGKQRVHIYNALVKTAKKLLAHGDFSDAMAIVAALENPVVTRLNVPRSLSEHNRKEWEEVSALFSPKENCKALRTAIAELRSQHIPYCFPQAIALKDFTFANENPSLLDGLPNFDKLKMIGGIHQTIEDGHEPLDGQPFQTTLHYNVPQAIYHASFMDEDAKWERSFKISKHAAG